MQIKTASAISTGLHVLVLAWATLSFSSKPFETTPAESLPVDIVSEKEFSQLTKGIKDAPKPVEKPKPVDTSSSLSASEYTDSAHAVSADAARMPVVDTTAEHPSVSL